MAPGSPASSTASGSRSVCPSLRPESDSGLTSSIASTPPTATPAAWQYSSAFSRAAATARRRASARRSFNRVVWKVTDTAEALFEVDDFENFVHVQAESALRNLATSHPYDAHAEEEITLRGNPVEISAELRGEIQDRLERAGVEVIEARISHLAYAPEIANAMLRRQQANAVIAARTRIVEGAVGMVEMALEQLSSKGVVTLDEERKATMVSNLLVVLCSEHETQPVVNTGTLYA